MSDDRLRVRFIGSTTGRSAFELVNAQWRSGLEEAGHIVLGHDHEAAADDIDVTIVADWTRPFGPPGTPPGRGTVVAVRPWDFGPYPRRWIEVLDEHYDELWVHTNWIRRQAIVAGLDEDRVRVVPLGVDPMVFTPTGPIHPSVRPDRSTFLFVGATVVRKGIDILLEAWPRAFHATDNVQLIVKDHADGVFYEDQSRRADVLALAEARPDQVQLVGEHLDPTTLAALYRGADALVLPYRAEGFALSALETMACGTPAVLPRFGACLDYADDTNAVLVDVRRISLPVDREMTYNTLGFRERVTAVDFAEPDPDAVADALRTVHGESAEERHRRSRAAADTGAQWSWARSVDAVERGLDAAQTARRGAESGAP